MVVAGPPEQVDAVIAVVSAQDHWPAGSGRRRLHHAIIDPVLPDLRTELADLDPQPPAIPVFVTTGGRTGGQQRSDSGTDSGTELFDAAHWVDNLRNPVRFTQAVAAAGAHHTFFIEVSPHPLLSYAIDQSLEGVHHHTLGTLQRDTNDVHLPRQPQRHPYGAPAGGAASGRTASDAAGPPWHHTRHWLQVSAAPEQPAPAAASSRGSNDWFHRLTWPVRDLPAATAEGSWLVLGGDDTAAELAAQLRTGSRALDVGELDPAESEVLHAALAGADHVVYAPAPVSRIEAAPAYRLFNAVRRLVGALAGMAEPPTLFILTRNGQPIDEGDRSDPAHAVLWGWAAPSGWRIPRSGAASSTSTSPCRPSWSRGSWRPETQAGDDDQAVYRRGERHVPRLQPSAAPAVSLTSSRVIPAMVIGATGNVAFPHSPACRDGRLPPWSRYPEAAQGKLGDLATELRNWAPPWWRSRPTPPTRPR